MRPQRPVAVIIIDSGDSNNRNIGDLSGQLRSYAFQACRTIREQGHRVIHYLQAVARVRKLMQRANQDNAWAAILIGETELKNQTITIKLLDTARQVTLPCSEVSAFLEENDTREKAPS